MAWSVVVLTVPSGLWARLAHRRHYRELRARVWPMVAAWMARWGYRDEVPAADLLGLVIGHPCGEVGDWQPHFNAMLPCVSARGRRGRWMLPREALDDLRSRWSAVLVESGADLACGVQVFYEPRTEDGQRRHAARYFARRFHGWAIWSQSLSAHGALRRRDWSPWWCSAPLRWRDEPGERCALTACHVCGGWASVAEEWRVGPSGVRHGRQARTWEWTDPLSHDAPAPDLVRGFVEVWRSRMVRGAA